MCVFACGSVYSVYVNQWEPEVLLAAQSSCPPQDPVLSYRSAVLNNLNHQTG